MQYSWHKHMILRTTTPLCISQGKIGQATIVAAEHEIGTGIEITAMVAGMEITIMAMVGSEIVNCTVEEVTITITERVLTPIAINTTNLGMWPQSAPTYLRLLIEDLKVRQKIPEAPVQQLFC